MFDTCDGPVTLLGHSCGGAVVTVTGTHPAVERIVLPDSQRANAERSGATVVEIAGNHSPIVARPAELATILATTIT